MWEPTLRGIEAVHVVDSQGPDAPAEVRAFGAVAARTGVQRHPGNGGPPASAANRIGW